jgi:hypothetical protein
MTLKGLQTPQRWHHWSTVLDRFVTTVAVDQQKKRQAK